MWGYTSSKNQPLRNIPYISSNIDPLMYPLIFPRGEPGWDPNLNHADADANNRRRNRLTQLEYYLYRMAIRPIL